MAQNCHPANPTGSFGIQKTVANNTKGMTVAIDLPSDQDKYELDGDPVARSNGSELTIEITLKASATSAGPTLDAQVNGYSEDASGNLTASVILNVWEMKSGVCKKKKKEEEDLDGNYQKD